VSGSDLFVEQLGTIAQYTTSGTLVNASLISGLGAVTHLLAVSGSDLFVVSGQNIGEYTTSGATVNPSLISGFLSAGIFDIGGIAVDGANLFVTDNPGGRIAEYTTSGALVNASLISGLALPTDIAIAPTAVPEPGTLILLGTILLALGTVKRKLLK
jgi:hypothetical protein